MGHRPKAIIMKIINTKQTLLVNGGDRWGAEKTNTISEAQSQLLSECVGSSAGHDGGSAVSCLFLLISLIK
jgi:hypothetical protein